MKIKKGDKVLVTKGKDNGIVAQVLSVDLVRERVLVDGVNKMKKHVRPKQENQKGQRVEIEAPFGVSNVKLVCPKCNKTSRIGYKFIENSRDLKDLKGQTIIKKKKVRICKKCQQEI